ncbi:MAG: tripartite tricarboxylate transporter TctB family protein [Gammaproteobacteria bacterium]|nr:tripartite tricarboxylate transporter TctB family protein [Gammaproteobacteria bacterium]
MSLDRCIAIFFLVISLAYGYSALNYPLLPFERNMAFLPNTMPMVLGVLGAGLSLVILITPRSADANQENATTPELGHVVQAVLLLVAMVLFALALRPLGFILATSLFLVGCGVVLGERKFHLMIPIAAFSAFTIWYLVQEVLGIFMRPWTGVGG